MSSKTNYHTMDGPKHSFTFKIDKLDNGTYMASVVHDRPSKPPDDLGALYYVIAVLFIYGCSILMMLASYVRKNKMDQKLNRYHKEMINVRKRERQLQLCNAAKKAAAAGILQEDGLSSGTDQKDGKRHLKNISETSDGSDSEERCDKPIRSPYPGRYQHSDKMFLEPPPGCYNTDSDNDTSTEGEISYIPAITRPARSILKTSKSVTLVIPPAGEQTLKPIWSCDSDSCYSAEVSPQLEHKQPTIRTGVSVV